MVRTLVNGTLNSGSYRYFWNGSTDPGSSAASGIYYVCLYTDSMLTPFKLVLLR